MYTVLFYILQFDAMKKKLELGLNNQTIGNEDVLQTVTGRVKNSQIAPLPAKLKVHATTQTILDF